MSNTTYEAIHRLLAEHGLVVLHKGQAPVNPYNLFDLLVGQGRRVTVEVDDAFVEEMGDLAGDSHSNHPLEIVSVDPVI
jgi:hypothetical protein